MGARISQRPTPAPSAATVTPTEFQWFPPSETPIVDWHTPRRLRRGGQAWAIGDRDPMTSALLMACICLRRGGRDGIREALLSPLAGQPPWSASIGARVFDDMYIEVTARP